LSAKRVDTCLGVILGIRNILWPPTPPRNGQTVRRKLLAFLRRAQRNAPQRGRGAYLRCFIENALNVTHRYAFGLFHCYDDLRIPQTTNSLEGTHGLGKRNLRRCGGRGSTANGPGTSCGAAYMMSVTLNACMPKADLDARLARVPSTDYDRARRALEQTRAPARRRRAMLRNPSRHLAGILHQWKGP
jgi:hypothetical protein